VVTCKSLSTSPGAKLELLPPEEDGPATRKQTVSAQEEELDNSDINKVAGAWRTLYHILLPRSLRCRSLLCRLQILVLFTTYMRLSLSISYNCKYETLCFSTEVIPCVCVCNWRNEIIKRSKLLQLLYLKQQRRSSRSDFSEESLNVYLEELAIEHQRQSLVQGSLHIDQWKGHSLGYTTYPFFIFFFNHVFLLGWKHEIFY
jgi:hypothetical protein